MSPVIVIPDTMTATIVAAASNSLDPTLAPAAYRCNGVEDNVEINAALTAAAAVNGSVVLLEGDYNTVLTLSVAVNVTLKAVGWGAVINFNAAGNAITIAGDNVKLRDFKVVIVAGAGAGGSRPNAVYATARTNVEITKLWLVGDETEVDDGSHLRQVGILFGINMSYSKILGCTVQDFERHGINLEGTSGNEQTYIEIEGNICFSNLDDGIRMTYSDYCTFTGNTCQGNTLDGIRMDHAISCTVTGNTCSGNGWGGIILWAASTNNTVSGNTCTGNAIWAGIYLRDSSDNNTVSGNTCTGNTGFSEGIGLHGSSSNTVSGNTCTGNAGSGIEISSAGIASINNTVSGNTCTGNGVSGILLQTAGTDYNTVTGNTCSFNVEHGISLSQTDYTTIVGNTCVGNDSGNTASFDGIWLQGSVRTLILGNLCVDNDRWGIYLTSNADYSKVSNNYTDGNTSGSIRIDNAIAENCTIEFNTVEEGIIQDAGTNTRSYGNFDPSANAFVGDVGAAPW